MTAETLGAYIAQYGFPMVAFCLLAWWTARRTDASEARNTAKVDELERYIRTEFAELCERQGTVIVDCTSVLREVRDELKGRRHG